MHPRQPAGDAEPGLAEEHDLAGQQRLAIALTAGWVNAAIFFAAAAMTAGAGRQPNISPRAVQARSFDRNWACHRYVPSAASRGPYCTGALTPFGASALVFCPQHGHSRSMRPSRHSARTRHRRAGRLDHAR
jgi:hypothetical protein